MTFSQFCSIAGACLIGGVEFWIDFTFNFLQLAIDGNNNFKTKVEKVLFFIFMSSFAKMSFLI
jgi:hypothetical protein